MTMEIIVVRDNLKVIKKDKTIYFVTGTDLREPDYDYPIHVARSLERAEEVFDKFIRTLRRLYGMPLQFVELALESATIK
jgi:hypothetical protein